MCVAEFLVLGVRGSLAEHDDLHTRTPSPTARISDNKTNKQTNTEKASEYKNIFSGFLLFIASVSNECPKRNSYNELAERVLFPRALQVLYLTMITKITFFEVY